MGEAQRAGESGWLPWLIMVRGVGIRKKKRVFRERDGIEKVCMSDDGVDDRELNGSEVR